MQKFNWIIDPIDGTTNFINGLQYAVSVALVYEQPDHILLGVVYNPKDDIWYYACKGKGSYILEKGMVTQLRVRTFPPDEGIVVFGMPYDRSEDREDIRYCTEVLCNRIGYEADRQRLLLISVW